MIGHVRVVPDFGIAVEEVTRPELSSHPVIMGGLPEQHGVVREANILAQQIGVRAGMTLRQAHQLCPEGIFLIPDLPRYEGVWQQVCDALRIFTPLVESLQMGQAVLDLQGSERHFANSREAARAVQARVRNETGLMVWIGLASNRLVAQLVSMSPNSDGIGIVAIGKEREFLADLPLTLLPNVDSRLALTFQVLGLRTIGQLAALPAQAVRQRFGSAGETLHRYARGRDSRPVIARQALPSISMRQECDEGSIEEVVAALSSLAERCATELERQQLAGHLITIALIWGSGPSFFPMNCRPIRVIESNHHKALIATGPQPADSSNPPPSAMEHTSALASPHSSVTHQNLPIDYRIHSMLPQPGTARSEPSSTLLTVRNDEEPSPNKEFSLSPSTVALRGDEFKTAARAVARSAICSAVPLVEQGQRLVMQLWKTRPQGAEVVRALELTVSEFEPPSQLSFTELNRLSETGGLAGMSPDRLNTLRRQEQLLSARYGDASFRHLADLDPGNTLAERRFQWRAGLSWPQPRSLRRR